MTKVWNRVAFAAMLVGTVGLIPSTVEAQRRTPAVTRPARTAAVAPRVMQSENSVSVSSQTVFITDNANNRIVGANLAARKSMFGGTSGLALSNMLFGDNRKDVLFAGLNATHEYTSQRLKVNASLGGQVVSVPNMDDRFEQSYSVGIGVTPDRTKNSSVGFSAKYDRSTMSGIAQYLRNDVDVKSVAVAGEWMIEPRTTVTATFTSMDLTDNNAGESLVVTGRRNISNGFSVGGRLVNQWYDHTVRRYWSPAFYSSITGQLGYAIPRNDGWRGSVVVSVGAQKETDIDFHKTYSVMGNVAHRVADRAWLRINGRIGEDAFVLNREGYRWGYVSVGLVIN